MRAEAAVHCQPEPLKSRLVRASALPAIPTCAAATVNPRAPIDCRHAAKRLLASTSSAGCVAVAAGAEAGGGARAGLAAGDPAGGALVATRGGGADPPLAIRESAKPAKAITATATT